MSNQTGEESWLPHGLYQMVLTVPMNSLVSTYGMSSVALFMGRSLSGTQSLLVLPYLRLADTELSHYYSMFSHYYSISIYYHSMFVHSYSIFTIVIQCIFICIRCIQLLFDTFAFVFNVHFRGGGGAEKSTLCTLV